MIYALNHAYVTLSNQHPMKLKIGYKMQGLLHLMAGKLAYHFLTMNYNTIQPPTFHSLNAPFMTSVWLGNGRISCSMYI